MTPVEALTTAGAGVAVGVVGLEVARRLRAARDVPMPDALYVVDGVPGVWFDTLGRLHDVGSWLPKARRARARAARMLLGENPRWEGVPGGLWRPEGEPFHVYEYGEPLTRPADRLIIRRYNNFARADTGQDLEQGAIQLSLGCEPGMVFVRVAWACHFPLPPLDGVYASFSATPGTAWNQVFDLSQAPPGESSNFPYVLATWFRDSRAGRR